MYKVIALLGLVFSFIASVFLKGQQNGKRGAEVKDDKEKIKDDETENTIDKVVSGIESQHYDKDDLVKDLNNDKF